MKTLLVPDGCGGDAHPVGARALQVGPSAAARSKQRCWRELAQKLTEPPFLKALEEVFRLATRDGWCNQADARPFELTSYSPIEVPRIFHCGWPNLHALVIDG